MGERRKIEFQGKETWGEEVEFETEKESWNEYILQDGTRLKMKTVVSDVLRIENAFTPTGDPVYFVNASNVMTAIVPERLKRRS